MDKLDLLFQIKSTARHIENNLMSPDGEIVESAKTALKELADRFHREYGQFMSSQQYEWARNDTDYFMFLIEEALAHYKRLVTEGKDF